MPSITKLYETNDTTNQPNKNTTPKRNFAMYDTMIKRFSSIMNHPKSSRVNKVNVIVKKDSTLNT
jgi:hypothetical protein